ncbi:MAG TPA: DNA-processing protein DprA, partial [Polyangiaceae bacterium]|nr:DNA-processing protein DprA [Polyangiaceae bacterium]
MDPRTVALDAPEYPALLRSTQAAVPLRVRGALSIAPAVAIVGTREATPPALAFARELAAGVARAGVAVWSGGAEGIDTAAHEGALSVGGATVVVLGSGLDYTFPAANAGLFERVVRG